ncbi:hypothetical protein [uncultured Shewanella sp.]|uniref:hypothetical protein n=1 Tax=uncultured Shewanella sp. TaxID=173975 RepID=UPI00262A4F1F|nr:hypothetical protein [uncultured Shewanella sp.]
MSKLIGLLSIFVLFSLASCSQVLKAEHDEIAVVKPSLSEDKVAVRIGFIGKWLSKQSTKGGGSREAIINRFEDGQYIIEIKIFNSSGVLTTIQKEFGFWGVSGGVYFTIHRGWIADDQLYSSDPSDAYHYDSYDIIEISNNKLKYQSLSGGDTYTYLKIN